MRARILKHLLEAEKSTFQEELSFQRSKNITGLKQEHVFVLFEKVVLYRLNKRMKVFQITQNS
jgi:hypothetical protein